MPNTKRYSFRAAGRPKLPHNRGDVKFRGVFGDAKAWSDLLITEPGGEQLQHFKFPRREGLDEIRGD
jgi:hypothetical protein